MVEIKVLEFKSSNKNDKKECLEELTTFLNDFSQNTNIEIIDVDKEWIKDETCAYYKPNLSLTAYILYKEKYENATSKEETFGLKDKIISFEHYENGENLGVKFGKVFYHLVAEEANKIGMACPLLTVVTLDDKKEIEIAEWQVLEVF